MVERAWRIAVACFDHMHAGDQLSVARANSALRLVGAFDHQLDRMNAVCDELRIPNELRYDDVDTLLEKSKPDIVVVCSTTAAHMEWVDRLAQRGIHIVLEKPFATSLTEADRMIDSAEEGGVTLAVNWPLAWYPPHRTTRRLIRDGVVGDVVEVHYYDGNRGPLSHSHGKTAIDGDVSRAEKSKTWWYQRATGGGATLDYLGYGATIATWFRDGTMPDSVVAATHVPDGLEVDEQGVVVASYATGLSTFQTRWGTFTDPWTHQPQPSCGFIVVGTEGTIASWDYAQTLHLQTRERPDGVDIRVDVLRQEESNALGFLVDRLRRGIAIDGPMSWETSRSGQRIVDTALISAESGVRTMLVGTDRSAS